MSKQVAALLKGLDYQHLYSWLEILELKMPEKRVREVRVEDPDAGSVDDVTVRHEDNTSLPDRFLQIKYHVDCRGSYSSAGFAESPPETSSFLEKFWRSWQRLRRDNPEKEVELHLVSNWPWDPTDPLKEYIEGDDGRIKDAFFASTCTTRAQAVRQRWQEALHAAADDFERFLRCLRFRCGGNCTSEIKERLDDRMGRLGLRSDEKSLQVAAGITREWIKSGKNRITLDDLEAVLAQYGLYTPAEERRVAIHIFTVKAHRFGIEPDYSLDWREHFSGSTSKKGHQLKRPTDWNGLLLPELEDMAARIGEETGCRLVRVCGLSRLSVGFAFGYTFSEVAGYTLEVDQYGQMWRTDAPPSPDFPLLITNTGAMTDGEPIDGEGGAVAVGISIARPIDDDVRLDLQQRPERVAALLLIRPIREPGRECVRNASDLVALVDGAKVKMYAFVRRWGAQRMLLYYSGPLGGAYFIGHRLNAVCREIQIMEHQNPGYTPSFLLS